MLSILKYLLCLSLVNIAIANQSKIKNFIGVDAKIVWLRAKNKKVNDVFIRTKDYKIVTKSSLENEKVITEKYRLYRKPLISPYGNFIAYTDSEYNARVIRWNGTDDKIIKKNAVALAFWLDKKTGIAWLYCGTDIIKKKWDTYPSKIIRFPILNPKNIETIWTRTWINIDNIQISENGQMLSGSFPWPKTGIANIKENSINSINNGTWASLSPDNKNNFFSLNKNLNRLNFRNGTKLKFNKSMHIFHPRWSNHSKFITFSGPYPNKEITSSKKAEIYISNLKAKTLKITKNDLPDYMPDLWIHKKIPSPKIKISKWPLLKNDITFIWKNNSSENIINLPTGLYHNTALKLKGKAKINKYGAIDCSNGYALIDKKSQNAVNNSLSPSLYNNHQANFAIEFLHTTTKNKKSKIITLPFEKKFALAYNNYKIYLQIEKKKIPLSNTKLFYPTHLILNFFPSQNKGQAFINGQFICDFNCNTKINPKKILKIGSKTWHGFAEAIAIFKNNFTFDSVKKEFLTLKDEYDLENRHRANHIITNVQIQKISKHSEKYLSALCIIKSIDQGVLFKKKINLLLNKNQKLIEKNTYKLEIENSKYHKNSKNVNQKNSYFLISILKNHDNSKTKQ